METVWWNDYVLLARHEWCVHTAQCIWSMKNRICGITHVSLNSKLNFFYGGARYEFVFFRRIKFPRYYFLIWFYGHQIDRGFSTAFTSNHKPVSLNKWLVWTCFPVRFIQIDSNENEKMEVDRWYFRKINNRNWRCKKKLLHIQVNWSPLCKIKSRLFDLTLMGNGSTLNIKMKLFKSILRVNVYI